MHLFCRVPRLAYAAAAVYVVAALVVVALKGTGVSTFAACGLCAVLAVASVTDIRARIVPNVCIVVGIAFWAAMVAWQALASTSDTAALIDGVASGLAGALGVSVFLLLVGYAFEALAGKQGLGGGDIKLFFVTGLYLGLAGNVLNLFLSCVLGALFGWWWNRRARRAPVACDVTGTSSTRAPATATPTSAPATARVRPDGGFPFAPAIALSTWMCLLL